MKKKRTEYESKDENAFALSTGDLMASLLFIFILLLMGALLQVQEKAEQDEEIVKRYDQIKTQLYIDLQQEFKDDLAVWRATIDSTLCIVFTPVIVTYSCRNLPHASVLPFKCIGEHQVTFSDTLEEYS